MDLEIRHLRLVVALAEHRTLTRAGDVLHLTQSALSHQLRDLEDRVGKPLFTRARRQMLPTPAGDKLVQAARAVLATLDDTSRALRADHLASPIPLRVATECNTCYSWLPAVLPPFRERFPRVEIRLELSAAHQLLSSLADDQLDVAIMSSPVRDRRVVAKPLFEDELPPVSDLPVSRPLEDAVLRVGELLVVVEEELAAEGGGRGREGIDAEAPAGDVDLVDAVVADVADAEVVPESPHAREQIRLVGTLALIPAFSPQGEGERLAVAWQIERVIGLAQRP